LARRRIYPFSKLSGGISMTKKILKGTVIGFLDDLAPGNIAHHILFPEGSPDMQSYFEPGERIPRQ